jgi:hypothetical protein
MTPTPTPRTDAAEHEGLLRGSATPAKVVRADFARQLERDITELNERLQERTQSHIHASARDVQTIQRQAVQLAKLRALADGLAKSIGGLSPIYGTTPSQDAALSAYMAAKLIDPANNFCDWRSDYDGNWDTGCRQCMCFEHAPPAFQGYKFCHHCGLPINFIKFIKPLDESLD